MNHACEPTLLPEEVVQLRGYFRIVFIALRHIYPGEELTFDYSAPGLTLGPACHACNPYTHNHMPTVPELLRVVTTTRFYARVTVPCQRASLQRQGYRARRRGCSTLSMRHQGRVPGLALCLGASS